MPGTITKIVRPHNARRARTNLVNLSPAQVNCLHPHRRTLKNEDDDKTEQCLSCGVTIRTIVEREDELALA